jgi:hypothetical protein
MNIRSATRAVAFALCCASLAGVAALAFAQDKIERPAPPTCSLASSPTR